MVDRTPGPTSLLRGDVDPPSRSKRLKHRWVKIDQAQMYDKCTPRLRGIWEVGRWVRSKMGLTHLRQIFEIQPTYA